VNRPLAFIPVICQGYEESEKFTAGIGQRDAHVQIAIGDVAGRTAATTKLHRTYIGSVERGERNISLQNIDRLLTSLNKSWIDLDKALGDELDRK